MPATALRNCRAYRSSEIALASAKTVASAIDMAVAVATVAPSALDLGNEGANVQPANLPRPAAPHAAIDGRAARATGNHLVAQNDEAEPLAVTHAITRIHGGAGLDGYIVPRCTCGWAGRAEYAHNDWQHTNLREQEQAHMRGAR